MGNRYKKQAIRISQQIEVLRCRGLIIDDEVQVEKVLDNISYFRLANYWRFMEADRLTHQFKPGSHFDDVVDCYYFDKELKSLLFSAIQSIEVAMRAKVIKHFTSQSGAFWFMQSELAVNETFFTSNLEHVRLEISRSREDFITEHFRKYTSPDLPPVWKTLEVVSFGTLSKLYSNFHDATAKHLVAREFGLNHHKFLRSWMEMLCVLRNYCAHHARVWNRNFPVKPQMPKRLPNAWISNMEFPCGSLYPQLCCIAYWLNSIYPTNSFNTDIKTLFHRHPAVNARLMGFPKGWEEEQLWTMANDDSSAYMR